MTFYNEMKLQMLSSSHNEGFARTVIASFIAGLDPTIAELTEIKTAVSEAVTNAIIHGYEKDPGMVYLFCSIKDRDVYIEVWDDGQGIKDVEEAMTPLYTSKPEMERSGLGFTVMSEFMDAVTVESQPGKGTKIMMTRKLQGQ